MVQALHDLHHELPAMSPHPFQREDHKQRFAQQVKRHLHQPESGFENVIQVAKGDK